MFDIKITSQIFPQNNNQISTIQTSFDGQKNYGKETLVEIIFHEQVNKIYQNRSEISKVNYVQFCDIRRIKVNEKFYNKRNLKQQQAIRQIKIENSNQEFDQFMNFQNQINTIKQQLEILQRLKYKLNNQLRSAKSMCKLKGIIRLLKHIRQFPQELPIHEIKNFQYQSDQFLEFLNMVECKCLQLGKIVEEFLESGYLVQYSGILLGCLSRISWIVEKLKKKGIVLQKIKKKGLKNKKRIQIK